MLRNDVIENVNRVMPYLAHAQKVASSPLLSRVNKNVWVTGNERWFTSHLRHVAIRQPPTWIGRVVSDAELVTSWLASVALKGAEIFDADAFGVSTKYLTITDLVSPPDLIVIRMGVKVARNVAANEVLAEAINLRVCEKKPTWIWDQPDNRLAHGHLFWSDSVGRALQGFEPVEVGSDGRSAELKVNTLVSPSVLGQQMDSIQKLLSEDRTENQAKPAKKSLRGPK